MSVPRSVSLKIERANEHIADLEREIQAFNERRPYTIRQEREDETGDLVFPVAIREALPERWSGIIGDAIHNLRSALDHLVVALVAVNDKPVNRRHEFPVFDSAQAYKAQARRKVNGVAKDARDAIDALKPYKGGNDPFWQIHQLDIIDKHHTLVTVVASNSAVVLDPAKRMADLFPDFFQDVDPSEMAMPLGIVPKYRRFVDGDMLYKVSSGSVLPSDNQTEFMFEVALDEPQILESDPIHPTLVHFAGLVEHAVAQFAGFFPAGWTSPHENRPPDSDPPRTPLSIRSMSSGSWEAPESA